MMKIRKNNESFTEPYSVFHTCFDKWMKIFLQQQNSSSSFIIIYHQNLGSMMMMINNMMKAQYMCVWKKGRSKEKRLQTILRTIFATTCRGCCCCRSINYPFKKNICPPKMWRICVCEIHISQWMWMNKWMIQNSNSKLHPDSVQKKKWCGFFFKCARFFL